MKKVIFLFCIMPIFLIPIRANAIARGIDVSDYQGNIDFAKVRDDGIEVVYIRSSVGNSFVDIKFRQNYENAKANGLKVGFYHFVTARNVEEAKEQARFFSHVIRGTKPDCRLAIDFENLRGLSRDEVNEIARAFIETTEELTKKEMIVYSDAYNAARMFDSYLAENYPLWIAEYEVPRPEVANWKDWTGWQYTDVGRVSGIIGNVDRDEFKDGVYLRDSSEVPNPEVSEKDSKKTIHYRVMPGDTIDKVAKEYNTTKEDIKKENQLKNDKLKPNQVLHIKTDYRYEIENTEKTHTYKVKYGDNLTYIAKKFSVTIKQLVIWNNIKNPNLIYTGETLIVSVPQKRHLIKYRIVKNDTLYFIAKDFNTTVRELVKLNNIKNPNLIYAGDILYIPESY